MGDAKQRMSSRKFLSIMGWCLIATGLLWFGKIDAEQWETLVTWLLPIYLISNVGQKMLTKGSDNAAKD